MAEWNNYLITMTNQDEQFFEKLGSRIKTLREEQNMTQVQLADLLGIRQQVIATYELGTRRIPASMIPDLAQILGISIETLFGMNNGTKRRGPSPKLQQQIEQLQRLPKSKQKFVSEFLETVLQQA